MKDPLLIITAVKNDPAGLKRTFDSLLPLNENFHHLIIENGDACQEMAEQWRASNPDQVRYVQSSDTGVYSAFNSAIRLHSQSRYVYFLNAGDELIEADGIVELVNLMETENSCWGYADLIVSDETGKWSYVYQITPFNRFLFALGIKVIQQQSTVYLVEALRFIGGFDETRTISADMLAHLKLLKIEKPTFVPRVVSRFYSGGISTRSRKAHARDWNQILMDEKIWFALPVRIFAPIVTSIWSWNLRKKGKAIYA